MERQEKILSLTASELLSAMRACTMTSTEITTVYCLRSMLAGSLLNSNADECFEEAIKQAQKVDVSNYSASFAVRMLHVFMMYINCFLLICVVLVC